MTDLHTHLLPGLDDGSADLAQTRELLQLEKTNGVERAFMTPHFYPEKMDLAQFLEKRDRAFQETLEILDPAVMPQIKTGAEVRYSPLLLEQDLSGLTLGNSAYLLLELPGHHYPAHLEQIITDLVMMGYTPILAHLERYRYFREQPELLFSLIQKGVLGQISVLSLFEKATRSFALACLKNSLAQIIASDAHDPINRPPCMAKMKEVLEPRQIETSERFAAAVWHNEPMPYYGPAPVKKRFFGYT